MLGKTNITTLEEGTVATEIEDYSWIQIQAGINGNFVKAVYKNGYLIAITADGTIAYTMDGEVWQTLKLEYTDCVLNDVDWDGSRFILVGSHTVDRIKNALVITSTDLTEYAMVNLIFSGSECLLVLPQNGKYILISEKNAVLYVERIRLDGDTAEKIDYKTINVQTYNCQHYSVAKNTNGILVYYTENQSPNYRHKIKRINSEGEQILVKSMDDLYNSTDYNKKKAVTVFECKDILYAMELFECTGYNLNRTTSSDEIMAVCTGQNFMFTDGVYFNECQIFINSHDMLVVKKNESIADKIVDDLVEIAPEFTINCITKAFGQLYIFGNQGIILKSSVESNNENAIAVQTLSAKKALAEAKIYADEKYAALEARIAALEAASKTE